MGLKWDDACPYACEEGCDDCGKDTAEKDDNIHDTDNLIIMALMTMTMMMFWRRTKITMTTFSTRSQPLCHRG